MTIAQTPTTPPALLRYRERHVIEPVKDWWDDMRHYDLVCGHDAIRVHEVRGGWKHDASEIADLVKRERGEKVAW